MKHPLRKLSKTLLKTLINLQMRTRGRPKKRLHVARTRCSMFLLKLLNNIKHILVKLNKSIAARTLVNKREGICEDDGRSYVMSSLSLRQKIGHHHHTYILSVSRSQFLLSGSGEGTKAATHTHKGRQKIGLTGNLKQKNSVKSLKHNKILDVELTMQYA